MRPRPQDDAGLIDLDSSLGDSDAHRETEADRLFLHVRPLQLPYGRVHPG
ncbi:hypothetical protein [Streptomyces hundungensis]